MTKSDTRTAAYSLRLEPELSEWVRERARAEDRSFNAQINRFIKKMKELEEQHNQRYA